MRKIFQPLTDGLWVLWQRSISHGYMPSKRVVNLRPSLYSLTEVILQLTMISLSTIGYFITRIFAGLCIILREINHPLTDGLCIISWRTNSVGQYTESRRLYSLLLGMEYGWSTSSAMYYTSDRARTLVAREVVLRLL